MFYCCISCRCSVLSFTIATLLNYQDVRRGLILERSVQTYNISRMSDVGPLCVIKETKDSMAFLFSPLFLSFQVWPQGLTSKHNLYLLQINGTFDKMFGFNIAPLPLIRPVWESMIHNYSLFLLKFHVIPYSTIVFPQFY